MLLGSYNFTSCSNIVSFLYGAKVAIIATIAMGMMHQLMAYSVQNDRPVTLQSNKPMDTAILSAVMMLGKCLTLIAYNLYV